MSTRDLLQAGVPCRIGSHDVRVTMMTDADEVELDTWLSGLYVAIARASAEGEGDESWKKTMAFAMEASIGISWTRGVGSKLIGTPRGLTYLAWVSVRQNSKVTYKQVFDAFIEDPKNLDEFLIAFKTANRLTSDENKEAKVAPDPTTSPA